VNGSGPGLGESAAMSCDGESGECYDGSQ
jgi:hypothetical protein